MKRYGKKAAAAVICAALAMSSLTGCSSVKAGEVVAKLDGTDITLGEANLMLRYNQAQTQSYLGGLFGEGQNIFQQDLTGSGVPYGTTMKESVLNELKTMVILEKHMGDYGVELTEEDQAAIDAAAKAFVSDNSKEVLKAMTADEDTVKRVLTLYTIEAKMDKAIKADVDTEVTDEEAAQKTIQYAYFTAPAAESEAETDTEAGSEAVSETETEAVTEAVSETETEAVTEAASETETEAATEAASETETESATEAASEAVSEEATEAESETEPTPEMLEAKATAQGVIDAVQAGSTLEDAVKAVDENKSVTDYSYGADETILNSNLKAAADQLKDGELCVEPVEGDNGYYVLQMVSTFDREATDEKKTEIVKTRENDLFNEKVESWEPESFDVDSKVWDQVNFDDIFTVKAEETEAVTEGASEGTTEEAAETETAAAEETTEAGSETETAAAEETSEAASETESETN